MKFVLVLFVISAFMSTVNGCKSKPVKKYIDRNVESTNVNQMSGPCYKWYIKFNVLYAGPVQVCNTAKYPHYVTARWWCLNQCEKYFERTYGIGTYKTNHITCTDKDYKYATQVNLQYGVGCECEAPLANRMFTNVRGYPHVAHTTIEVQTLKALADAWEHECVHPPQTPHEFSAPEVKQLTAPPVYQTIRPYPIITQPPQTPTPIKEFQLEIVPVDDMPGVYDVKWTAVMGTAAYSIIIIPLQGSMPVDSELVYWLVHGDAQQKLRIGSVLESRSYKLIVKSFGEKLISRESIINYEDGGDGNYYGDIEHPFVRRSPSDRRVKIDSVLGYDSAATSFIIKNTIRGTDNQVQEAKVWYPMITNNIAMGSAVKDDTAVELRLDTAMLPPASLACPYLRGEYEESDNDQQCSDSNTHCYVYVEDGYSECA